MGFSSLFCEVEEKGRHGRRWSLRRAAMALPKVAENQVPLKMFLWDAAKSALWWGLGRASGWGFYPSELWEPLAHIFRIVHLKSIPASRKLRDGACPCSEPRQGVMAAESGSSSVLALAAQGSPGWGRLFCTPWSAEKQNTFSSCNSEWVQIKGN